MHDSRIFFFAIRLGARDGLLAALHDSRGSLKETRDAQTCGLSRIRHDLICGRQPPAMNALGYRQMQGVQGS
jgi:hypothetical protein